MRKINRPALAAAVLVLSLWHLRDVQAGASASGDHWLTSGYLLLAAAAAGLLGALYWLFYGRKSPGAGTVLSDRLPGIYLLAGFGFGLLYLLVLPPLSAPDEISHYISAYELSSRFLGKEATAPDGHVLVRAADIWVEDVHGARQYEQQEDGYLQILPGGSEGAEVLGQTLTEDTYREIKSRLAGGKGSRGTGGAEQKEALVISPYPPVVTTPAAYVPQAFGMALARALGAGALGMLYLGRLFNLAFFVGMTCGAMRRLPFGREVLFGVAMLPMTLHLSASLSYDVMIMACMFCLTAVCLDLAYKKNQVSWGDVAVLAALMAAAGPCKMIYAVLMGLCLLIPAKKFGSRRRWLLSAAAVAGALFLGMALINGRTIAAYATGTDAYVEWAGETGYSLSLLLHNPLLAVRMFYQTFLWQAQQLHLTMIGSSLGNLDEVLDVPYLMVVFFTGGLILLALKKPGERKLMPAGGRIWTGVLCAGCVLAAMLSMLIAWTPLSSPVITGVQGRYFLPFLPALLMILKNDTLVLTKDINRSILYLMCCAQGYVLLRLYSIVSMRL
ncbi:MAG: DUF2142 domain-containing protein [Eubacteriales bacterium]|nr:DUF2142 domain-containing protein [Eubacteriales bacterium]